MMKWLIILLLLSFSSVISTVAYAAEDVLIIHQGYYNSHIKWKNRLEDAGHTVTSIDITSSSFPSNTTSYEQIYDVRHGWPNGDQNLSSAQITAYKALLARGGTLYLQAENPGCCNPRNQSVADFIEDEVGGGTVTYNSNMSTGYSSNSITQHNSNESWLSSFSGTVTFSAGGSFTSIGNGTWFAKDGNGKIVGAVWYGSDLSSAYTGKIVVITDINFNSHSSYYTNNNKNWMNAMRTMLASTYNTAVSITSAQATIKSTAQNATLAQGVFITQVGDNFTTNIQQKGDGNFIGDIDWSGNAIITGDDVTLTIKQGNVTTTGSSDDNGLGLAINGNSTNITVNQGDHANDKGEHRAIIDITGTSNVVSLIQYDGGTLAEHFFSLDVDGNSNNLTITQKDNNGKTMFLDVNGNSNTGTFIQEDVGTHYLDVTLDANHDVTITQRGNGNHAARVILAGYSTDFDLIQQGNTSQNYTLDNTCSNALGCTISTTQGTQ